MKILRAPQHTENIPGPFFKFPFDPRIHHTLDSPRCEALSHASQAHIMGTFCPWECMKVESNLLPCESHVEHLSCLHSLYQPILLSQFCGISLEYWSSFPLCSLGCLRGLYRLCTINRPAVTSFEWAMQVDIIFIYTYVNLFTYVYKINLDVYSVDNL